MKKSLVALAVMSALSVSAFAQSQVSVYGTVDAGLENVNSGGSSTTTMGSGQDVSRLGFKGVEDLGSGLKAEFNLEQGFKSDTGETTTANTVFSRQSWVGLSSSKLGGVRLGLQDTPIKAAAESIDPLGLALAGDASKVLGNGEYTLRSQNAVTYSTPSIAGFGASVQYGLGETANSTEQNSNYGLGLGYSAGKVQATLAWARKNTNSVGVDKQKNDWLVGGTYDFGVAKAHVGYGETESKDYVAVTNVKLQDYLVGVSVPLGKHNVVASYVRNEVRDASKAVSEQYSLGYTYSLSKRTNFYSSVAYTENQANVKINATANGVNSTKYNLGVRHTF